MKIKSILALLFAFITCFTFMTGCNKKSDEDTSTADEAKSTASTLEKTEDAPKEPFSILLVGIDDFNDLGNSDAILLLSIDDANRKLKITSFNRNTYVYIPGFDNANLSKAYTFGQADLLVKTIEDNFGAEINRYALANLFSFEDMLNAVGGVEMTLNEEEIAYINNMMKANGKTQQIESGAGAVTLSGEQALCHVRNLSEGDEFLRAGRQREFIKALIATFKKATVTELTSMASLAIPMLNTDMTTEEKVSLVNKIMTYLNYTVEECSMPSEGTYDVAGGMSDPRIIVNDWNKTKSDLNTFLYN